MSQQCQVSFGAFAALMPCDDAAALRTPQADEGSRVSLVSADSSHTFTTSLRVAEHFGKRHHHVLRAIRNLECKLIAVRAPERLNFEPLDYVNSRGKAQPMYRLTRNGFALLVMGFTGRPSLVGKLQLFFDAFDAMEALNTTLHPKPMNEAA